MSSRSSSRSRILTRLKLRSSTREQSLLRSQLPSRLLTARPTLMMRLMSHSSRLQGSLTRSCLAVSSMQLTLPLETTLTVLQMVTSSGLSSGRSLHLKPMMARKMMLLQLSQKMTSAPLMMTTPLTSQMSQKMTALKMIALVHSVMKTSLMSRMVTLKTAMKMLLLMR